MFILATKDNQLITLPQSRGMAHANTGYIAIVVDQIPLPSVEVQAEYVVVDLVCVLIEAAKSIDLTLANVRHRGTDETRGSLTDGADNLWFINLPTSPPILHRYA